VINRTASSLRVAAWEGYNATLKCIADGNPEPKYKWRNASGVIAESEVDGTLLIRPMDNSAFGDYTCQATNSRGMDSHTVTLIKVGKAFLLFLMILSAINVCIKTLQSQKKSCVSSHLHY